MKEGNHVEFDSDKLLGALRAGVDINDSPPEDVNKLLIDYQEELSDEVDQMQSSMNLASIGAEYKIGPLDITCVLGNLVLLSSINSPLVSADLKQGDALSFEDCIQAIYVMAMGKEAIKPIMGISQRINDLMLLKPLVKENPLIADKIIDKASEISKARVTFANEALVFWEENFVGFDFQEVINDMINMVADIGKSAQNLPEVTGEGKTSDGKKKA